MVTARRSESLYSSTLGGLKMVKHVEACWSFTVNGLFDTWLVTAPLRPSEDHTDFEGNSLYHILLWLDSVWSPRSRSCLSFYEGIVFGFAAVVFSKTTVHMYFERIGRFFPHMFTVCVELCWCCLFLLFCLLCLGLAGCGARSYTCLQNQPDFVWVWLYSRPSAHGHRRVSCGCALFFLPEESSLSEALLSNNSSPCRFKAPDLRHSGLPRYHVGSSFQSYS